MAHAYWSNTIRKTTRSSFNGIPIEGFRRVMIASTSSLTPKAIRTRSVPTATWCGTNPVTSERLSRFSSYGHVAIQQAPISVMYNGDIKAPNGLGVGPILIRNTRGVPRVCMGAQAWIQKMPKSTLGPRAIGSREWKIRVAKLEAFVWLKGVRRMRKDARIIVIDGNEFQGDPTWASPTAWSC
jgi:hypothetical protein